MKILALDTATEVASIAILSENKLISENIINHKLKHSKKLIKSLKQMFDSVELNFSDIDYFSIAAGPGSFTGLRIGLSTIKALAQVTNKPVIPISTLEALAFNISYSNGIICPMLDARRNQVYTALFRSDGSGQIERISKDQALNIPDLNEKLKKYSERIYILGDGAKKFKNELSLNNLLLIEPYLRLNQASSVAACSLKHLQDAQDFKLVEPRYLRPSYAEEKNLG